MSEPIHAHRGVIDKYIGDAIMAYWGPPFIEDSEQAISLPLLRSMCLAAWLSWLPELLGVRTIPADYDIRIGIATGEALVGSIGSDYMMSFTVMGDTVNLASAPGGSKQGIWLSRPDLGDDGKDVQNRYRAARDRPPGGEPSPRSPMRSWA